MNQESNIKVEDIELSVDSLDVEKAADIFEEHGCLVVRGLMKPYIDRINQDMEAAASESLALIEKAEKIVEGWRTPNGTLFIPAPDGYNRNKQIMVLAMNYQTSGAFFQSAFDENAIRIVEGNFGAKCRKYLATVSVYIRNLLADIPSTYIRIPHILNIVTKDQSAF